MINWPYITFPPINLLNAPLQQKSEKKLRGIPLNQSAPPTPQRGTYPQGDAQVTHRKIDAELTGNAQAYPQSYPQRRLLVVQRVRCLERLGE